MKKRKIERFNDILEIPREVSTTEPKITILSFNKMLIENHKGILEYQDIYVRIKTDIGLINISGLNLSLNEMRDNEIIINGKIEGVDFQSISD
ncbi:MAG: YabP/YqfC family sporulation protein [Clostridia bacterium]|nr:YabP/YqfC family sporulation protein [Clostridia bacterium]